MMFQVLLPGCKNIHNYDKLGGSAGISPIPAGFKKVINPTQIPRGCTRRSSIQSDGTGTGESWVDRMLHSLKLTYWWPLKNCGWETTFFLARAIFRAVSVVGSVKRFLLKLKGQGDISIIAFLFWVVMGLMLGRIIFENSTLQLNNS